MIRKISRKIIPSLFVAVLLLVVGGFCDGLVAEASPNLAKFRAMDASHCGNENNSISKKSGPIGGGLMPCCIGTNHDNSTTVLPDITSGKTNFSKAMIPAMMDGNFQDIDQKLYLSSSLSPPKPDILSSVCRLE
jgi:hypothetical protein